MRTGADGHAFPPSRFLLAGDLWNGPRLEAHTDNGPVSLNVPDSFRSGVRVETSKYSPISCKAGACQNAYTDASANQRFIQFNGAADTVRVSTNNGPVSVSGGSSKTKKII